MVSGLNVDVEYQGVLYHVQTESGSKTHPLVVTTVFKGGAILASRKSSFADILETPDLISNLRERMTRQHKATIEELKAGKIVQGPAIAAPQPASPPPSSSSPKPESRSRPRTLDDMILDYLSTKEEREK
jgi:hypothetical protein